MIDRQKSQTGMEILYKVQRHIVSHESDQISIFVFLKHSPSLRRANHHHHHYQLESVECLQDWTDVYISP